MIFIYIVQLLIAAIFLHKKFQGPERIAKTGEIFSFLPGTFRHRLTNISELNLQENSFYWNLHVMVTFHNTAVATKAPRHKGIFNTEFYFYLCLSALVAKNSINL